MLQKRKKELTKREERTRGIVSCFSKESRISYLKRVCSINTNIFYTLGFGRSITTDTTLKTRYLKILRENIARDFPNSYHVWRLEPRLSDGEPHLHILANVKDKLDNYIYDEFRRWIHKLWAHHIEECSEGFENPVHCVQTSNNNIKKYSAKDTENSNKDHIWSPGIIDFWEREAGNRWGAFPQGNYPKFVIEHRWKSLNKKEFKKFIRLCISIKKNQIRADRENDYPITKQQLYFYGLSKKPDNILLCLDKNSIQQLEEYLFGDVSVANKMLY